MTERDLELIRGMVKIYSNNHRFDIIKPENFTSMVNYIKVNLHKDIINIDEDELRVASAISLLGPQSIPISKLYYNELLKILRTAVSYSDKRVERAMEFTIAYGCGKWRKTKEGMGSWEQLWINAMIALRKALGPAVNDVDLWLHKNVVQFPNRRQDYPDYYVLNSDAHFLVLWLINPEASIQICRNTKIHITCTEDGTQILGLGDEELIIPPGGKSVWTVFRGNIGLITPRGEDLILPVNTKIIVTARDDETRIEIQSAGTKKLLKFHIDETTQITGDATLNLWECSCGNIHCHTRHRIEAWVPSEVSLWSYIASAVKGRPAVKGRWVDTAEGEKKQVIDIHTGSLVQGMYFALLANEGINI